MILYFFALLLCTSLNVQEERTATTEAVMDMVGAFTAAERLELNQLIAEKCSKMVFYPKKLVSKKFNKK